jgi:putative ABC transport system permease protein
MLKIDNLTKTYTVGKFVTKALDNLSIEFRQREFVGVLGPSGCGKTTLLNMIGALDTPDTGLVSLNGNYLKDFSNKQLDKYRNHSIGYIFQTHNLVQHLSIVENVEMGMILGGKNKKESRKKALDLLDKVGLTPHLHKKPNELSVGQSQRVAIARALVNDPDIILADEPTGAVDSKTAIEILDLIKEFGKDKLVIMVTHNPELVKNYATRIVKLHDGMIVSDSNPYFSDNLLKPYEVKKNFMSFLTSLMMSFKNLKTKPGRSILMAFATSIGLLGIALILALSGGIKQEIIKLQTKIIGNYPINISYNSYQQEKLIYIEDFTKEAFIEKNAVIPVEKRWTVEDDPTKFNHITDDYLNYINDYYEKNPSKIVGLTVKPKMTYSIYYETTDNIDNNHSRFCYDDGNPTHINDQPSRLATLLPEGEIFDEMYEYVVGDEPATINDLDNKTLGVVLVVNQYNRISAWTLTALGYDPNEQNNIPLESFIGLELLLWPGATYFTNFTRDEAIKLKVSGIIKRKTSSDYLYLFDHGIGYTSDLVDYLSKNYPETVSSNDYDYIHIYAADFKSKEEIANHLDLYNQSLPPESKKVEYFDRSSFYIKHIERIIDIIMIGLIVFSSVSLGVSSVMIATITFTSVVERTKEIGILRAIGARKVDVFRIFSGENLFIGLTAGLIAVVTSLLLTIPINFIAKNYYSITQLAKVNLWHSLILIGFSLLLTFSAGLYPSRIATNKNPVESLRVE